MAFPAICLFPYTDPALKTEGCEEAWNPDNLSNRAIRAIKAAVPEIAVMTDVALDPYNANGHDGIVRDGEIVNDETVEALVRMALAQAEAGADILGPSDMMDGRIGAMRAALEAAGHATSRSCPMPRNTPAPSTARSAMRSAPRARSRATRTPTRWTPANGDEALRLVERDLTEGADMVMVKPGMPYLDICRRVKDTFGVPTYAYQVSGEYAMLHGGGRERLARRRQGDDGKPAGLQARGLRRDPDLFRPGGGPPIAGRQPGAETATSE